MPAKKTNATQPVVNNARNVASVPIARIDPDPRNPGRHRITAADIKQMAADIKLHDLQQCIKVRPIADRFQIVYGERRYRAALLLGWQYIDAEVETLTDAEAGQRQAIENSQRKDVDVFAIAEHLQHLTGKQADGSKPLTQKAAGQCYGISQAETSNRIRLLQLPDAVRRFVIAGHLPIRAARELLPWASCPAMMDAAAVDLNLAVEESEEHGDSYQLDDWQHQPAAEMRRIQRTTCRPTDGKTTHHVDWQLNIAQKFKPTAEQLTELAVFELPDLTATPAKGKAWPTTTYATNATLWDELQKPHAAAHLAKKAAARGSSGGQAVRAVKPAEDADPKAVAAYDKAKAKERTEQLAKKAEAWQLRLLRLTAARAIESLPADDDELLPLALFALQAIGAANHSACTIAQELLSLAAAKAAGEAVKFKHEPSPWNAAASKHAPVLETLLAVPAADRPELLRWIARFVLWPVDPAGDSATAGWLHGRTPAAVAAAKNDQGSDTSTQLDAFGPPPLDFDALPLTPAAVVRLAGLAGVDYPKAWQACATNDAEHELFTQGLALHRKAELETIAKQLKHELQATKASEIVAELALLHNGSKRLQAFGLFKAPAARQPKATRRRVAKKPAKAAR